MILFDDIGSYPLPENIKDWNKEKITQAVKSSDPKIMSIIKDAMWQKIEAGIDVPTYPQFQDMHQQFLGIIKDESAWEEPFIVRKEKARINELSAIEDIGTEYYKKNGKKLNVRICVTGPLELHLIEFGNTVKSANLNPLATSIDRFISNSIDNAKQFNISTVSIDEPSIGINPWIVFEESDLKEAWEKAAKTAARHKIDTQIHFHDPLYYKLICDVPSISIIGFHYSRDYTKPGDNLGLIDIKDLEKYDKFLRIGVSRVDIDRMADQVREKYNLGTDILKNPSMLAMREKIFTEMEIQEVIEKRLEKAYSLFGDRIKYAGPDCGFGGWPAQEMAFRHIKNTGIGINEF